MKVRTVTYKKGAAVGFGVQYETVLEEPFHSQSPGIVSRVFSIRLWRTVIRWSW